MRTLAAATMLVVASCAVAQAQREARPREDSKALWQRIESVLTHPRCLNCHTSTEFPRQGDDRHRHLFQVMRGPKGSGVAAMQCATCHQETNQSMSGIPGGHNWHLAPLGMAWESKDGKPLASGALCRTLLDRKKNDNMDLAKLNEHMRNEPLVQWAWSPGVTRTGESRPTPPLSHGEFLRVFKLWSDMGARCP